MRLILFILSCFKRNIEKVNPKYTWNLDDSDIRSNTAMSCRWTLDKSKSLLIEDKLAKIQLMFHKFRNENERIQSTKSLPKLNMTKSFRDNKLLQIAIGIGKLDTIFKLKMKTFKRILFSQIQVK